MCYIVLVADSIAPNIIGITKMMNPVKEILDVIQNEAEFENSDIAKAVIDVMEKLGKDLVYLQYELSSDVEEAVIKMNKIAAQADSEIEVDEDDEDEDDEDDLDIFADDDDEDDDSDDDLIDLEEEDKDDKEEPTTNTNQA